MQTNYNPSVNIIRDAGKSFNYIPTPNGKRVVGQLVDDFKKGIRSFNLIGSYGTGKSSFLLALEQSLTKKKPYFEPHFITNPKVGIIKIVGSFQSIIDAFASELNVTNKKNRVEHILSELYNRYHDLGKKSALLFVVIDEFGKFLEYAAQNNPEQELYFVQQLAEFVNNTDHNFALITTIHQSFESYGFGLKETQRHEWSKIKGRFKEIVFNEPVEQLLFLAAEHVATRLTEKQSKKALQDSYAIFVKSKAFSITGNYSKEINEKIYPLDITAAYVLTLALQRYGQNERSLFSFLEATDFTSLDKFRRATSPFYSLPQVYDYLNFNLYSFITSHYNPDISALNVIKRAIEEVERNFDDDIDSYLKLVKAIGLLNIFSAAGSTLDKAFWTVYAQSCMGIQNASHLIDELERKNIIFFRKHSKRLILFEGTDLNIHEALIEVANRVGEITDISTLLSRYVDLDPILAKKHAVLKGTPRFFQYVVSEEPIDVAPEGEVDGFINLIFNERLTAQSVQEGSAHQQEAILYCYYSNSEEIKELLRSLEKTTKVLEEHRDDKIARRELENIQSSQKKVLTSFIVDSLFGSDTNVTWFWRGNRIEFTKKTELVAFLSQICDEVYASAPVFISELVNKHRVSGQIHNARKLYFRALATNWSLPDLGFDPGRFPAEKTLYLSLLKENNLATYVDEVSKGFRIKKGSSFSELWKYSNDFLKKAVKERKTVTEFVKGLQKRPFKLKQGLIDIWVPTFLFLRREDFALYSEGAFVPTMTGDTLDIISKSPQDFSVKAFEIEGVRLDIFNTYRIFLNLETKEALNTQSFIETVKPFMVFYKGLKEYSKHTNRISTEAKSFREAINKATDPEQVFFEALPNALGTSVTELQHDEDVYRAYIGKMQDVIRELRTSYDRLIDRFEAVIQDEVVFGKPTFTEYQQKLQRRYRNVKRHLLVPHQVKLLTRIDNPHDERDAWLSSLAVGVLDKPLDQLRDEEELKLYDRLKALLVELDSLTSLSEAVVDEVHEDVLGLQIDSFVDGIKKNLVRFPKKKSKEVADIQKELKAHLGKDRALNIAALAKLLKEMMDHE
jgi:DNA replication protein DnaC/ribosomal protein S15P/S13E